MISNVSSKEKSLKGYILMADSDNYTIDKTLLYCNYKDKSIQVAYSTILDNYRDYFEQYLEDVEVPEKYFYQPAAFSEYYYGTPDLDFLVLYFAKLFSMFDFTRKKIKALPPSRLVELNRLFVEYREEVKDSYNNPDEFL